jgi:tight adherence protein B
VSLDPHSFDLLGIGLLMLAAGLGAAACLGDRGPGRRLFRRYAAGLDRKARFLFLPTTGREMAIKQAVGIAVVALCAAVYPDPRWLYLGLIALLAPGLYLMLERRRRLKAMDAQIDGWLLMLANMLRSTGSLSEAVQSTCELVRVPLRQELDLVSKEIKLGRQLDDALREMADRVRLPNLSTVVTMVLVARTTGGELPSLLETTAGSLREMARLDGVLRSQTAQGKMQLAVLVLGPLALVWGLRRAEPHYFDALVDNPIGWFILGGAIALWIGSIVLARRILDVDY